jgi:CCR4-NOT transcriptional regulation complex NOT5 subunit
MNGQQPQNMGVQSALMQMLSSQQTPLSDSVKSTMSSSSYKDLNSGIASPTTQINMLNQAILKNAHGFANGSKIAHPVALHPEEDPSKVNLIALLKQLNQRKSSEEANAISATLAQVQGGRKVSM